MPDPSLSLSASPAEATDLTEVMPTRLDELAGTIREQHDLMVGYARKTLEHVIACGRALEEARSLVPEGQWYPWLRENVGLERSTVKMYLRIARYRRELEDAGVTTVQQAREYIRRHGLRLALETPLLPDETITKIHVLAHKGETQRSIARQLGIGRTTVQEHLAGRRQRPSERTPSGLPASSGAEEITDAMIESAATWLCQRFGDTGYFARVNDQVRSDALELLGLVLA